MRVRPKAIRRTGQILRETLWLPSVDKLLPGDVLFTRHIYGRSAQAVLQSKVIRKKTGGDFSHVAICTTPPVFIEAIGQGVSNISMSRCFAFDRDNVRVKRYHSSNVAAQAASWASPMLGQHYSVRKALATQLPIRAAADDRGTICSRLVRDAFANAGAPELLQLDADKVTPAIIDGIAGFRDITDQIFREGLTPKNAERLSALDGDYIRSPADRQTALLAGYIEEIWPRLTALNALNAQYQVPRSFFEAVESIANLLMVAADRGETTGLAQELHEIDNLIANCFRRGELDEVAAEAYKLELDDLARMEHELQRENPDIDFDQLGQVLASGQRLIESREHMLGRLKRLATVSTSATLLRDFQALLAERTKERLRRQQRVFEQLKAQQDPA